MPENHPPDIVALEEAFDAAGRDARSLVTGLTEELGAVRIDADSWSVAECLDHLAIGNRVYLHAMEPVGERALREGRRRRAPAKPGLAGGWFVRVLEPPVRRRFRIEAPRSIRPRSAPSLKDAFGALPRAARCGTHLLGPVRRYRLGRDPLSQSFHSRSSIQPCHGSPRSCCARAPTPMASLARAPSRRAADPGCGVRTVAPPGGGPF